MKRIAILALLLVPAVARAADAPCYQWGPDSQCLLMVVPMTPTGNATVPFLPQTGGGSSVTSSSSAVTSTQTGGTLSATAGTFTQIVAGTARKNCLIQNTSSDYEYSYFGTAQTPTPTNSFPIPAGGSQSCSNGGTTSSNEPIFLASKSIANAPYVLVVN